MIEQEAALVRKRFLDETDYMEVQTSGSTGQPRFIKISKDHMQASARMTLDFLRLNKGDKTLLCMSPKHIGGIMMIIRAVEGGLNLSVTEPSARPIETLKDDFDLVAMVPYQVAASLDELPRIKKLIIGGGPINPGLEEKLNKLPNEIYHTYGMTETISHIAMRKVNSPDKEVFHTLPGIAVSQDHRGCLVVEAPRLGVHKLITNDQIELCGKGKFIWLGRYDNIVNSAGIKLHPEGIEKKMGSMGYHYFLAGLPDPRFGESLIMVVESKEKLTHNHFESAFKKLGKYEIPKRIITISEFVMTESGKLNRRETLKLIDQ